METFTMTTETATQEPTEGATEELDRAGYVPEEEPGKPQENLPAPATALTITPLQMLQVAVEQNADLEKMQKLMDLHERWEANQARKAYVKAMAAFKAEPHEIVKDTHVNFGTQKGATDYYHATLGQVCEVVGVGLAPHGLAHNWKTAQNEKGLITVTCVITHEEGHREEVSLSAMPDTSGSKNAIQALGSAVTYLERYTLMAATGLAAAGQDDDGAEAGDKPVPEERPTREQYRDTGPPPETDLGEPFELLDEFGESVGQFDDANACLDAASKYLGKDLSTAAGAAKAFHEHNQATLDRIIGVIGSSRDNTKVSSFFRLLNGKRGD